MPPRRVRAGHGDLPQRKSLQLAGFGLRQLCDEFDRARIFVRRDLALDVILQRGRQRCIAGDMPAASTT